MTLGQIVTVRQNHKLIFKINFVHIQCCHKIFKTITLQQQILIFYLTNQKVHLFIQDSPFLYGKTETIEYQVVRPTGCNKTMNKRKL